MFSRSTAPIRSLVTAATLLVASATQGMAQDFTDWSAPLSLGPAPLNTGATEGCPFVSKNGLSLYFASNRAGGMGGLDIYVSQRADKADPWGPPQNLGPNVNSAADDLCPTLTFDGHRLYHVSAKPGGCGGMDLYVSWRRDKRDDLAWEPAENLGCTLNSPFNDFTPAPVEDDATGEGLLYYTSNRPGGPGGTDIYVSARQEDGSFGEGTPVEELNTPENDQRPNVRKDGLEIVFDSNRPGSAGLDFWVSTRASTAEPWSPPANLGPVVNSPRSEGRATFSFHGTELYFMSDRAESTPGPTGAPSFDLYVTRREKHK